MVATIRRIAETATSLPAADRAVLVLTDGHGQLVDLSDGDPAGSALVRLETELGQGPSVTAIESDDVVTSPDATSDPRWPRLAGELRGYGLRAVLSVPIRVAGHAVGSLDLLSERLREFRSEEIDAAGAFADVTAEYLDAVASAEELAERLWTVRRSMAERMLVDQATGVLMGQTGLSAVDAGRQLQRTALVGNRSLTAVARTVLDRNGLVRPGPGDLPALERLTRLALAHLPAWELVARSLPEVRGLAGAEVAAVLLLGDDPAVLEGRVSAGDLPAPPRPVTVAARTGLCGQVLRSGALAMADGAVEDIGGVRPGSTVGLPLDFAGQTAGVLLVGRGEGGGFLPVELELLRRAADRLGPAVVAARLDELGARDRAGARRAVDRLTRLQAVSAALAATMTATEVARVVIEEGISAMAAAGGVIGVVAPGGELQLLAIGGYDEAISKRWRIVPVGARVPIAHALAEGRPIFLGSSREHDERFPDTSAYRVNPATASVPLVVGDRCIGALGLSFSEERPFDADDRAWITALADQCASALERARLYAEAEHDRQEAVAAGHRHAFLAEASAMLATSLDPEETLDQIAWLAVPRLADVCVVMLEEDGVLRPAATAYCDEALKARLDELAARVRASHVSEGLRAGRGPVAEAVATGRPVLRRGDELMFVLNQGADGDGPGPTLREAGISSLLVVPLKGRSEAFGLLIFNRMVGGGPEYTELDVALAEELTARAGIALDNARRFAALTSGPRAAPGD
jgi:GAF domain-containing protein